MDLTYIDELRLYFNKEYKINDYIILKQPSLGEIIEFGEENYFRIIQKLSCIPSDVKSELYDSGIDYEEISDFDLFIMMTRNLKKDDTYLLLKDIDLSEFEVCLDNQNGKTILYNFKTSAKIDEAIYIKIVSYIRKLHGIKPKVEKAANKMTKRILIDEDRERKRIASSKQFKSDLLPLISSMVNSNGFKYNSKQLYDIGFYEFMDSVQRISLIKNVESLLIGISSGNVDTTKIQQKDIDWKRRL